MTLILIKLLLISVSFWRFSIYHSKTTSIDGTGRPVQFRNINNQKYHDKSKGFGVDILVIEKTGHLTAISTAIVRGLQFIFIKPDLTLDTLLLKQYAGNYEHDFTISCKKSHTLISNFIFLVVMGKSNFKEMRKVKLQGFNF